MPAADRSPHDDPFNPIGFEAKNGSRGLQYFKFLADRSRFHFTVRSCRLLVLSR